MAAEFAKKFYNSTRWKRCRKTYVASLPSQLCMRCGVEIGTEVHHIIELTARNIHDDNITLSWDNLMLLCKQCHNDIHGRVNKHRAKFIFVNGYPVEVKS